jgi:hypothetical protein
LIGKDIAIFYFPGKVKEIKGYYSFAIDPPRYPINNIPEDFKLIPQFQITENSA